ncbi:5-carboxymethyl-2-hydroxymuconate Delta-isomerase [Shewanella colwelliana]|uniref:5-carboxymethyl-2-hydroxymuconate Delta-isomerase n=1 Tax=Shewanella colwelliana TaxID=23 RepID=UPI0037355749
MAMNLRFGQNNMPHCIIEYSASLETDIDIAQLVEAVHKGAIDSALFDAAAVKSRCIPVSHSKVGMLADGRFIHITFKIMPGRSTEQKQLLSNSVYRQIVILNQSVDSLTMEVLELDRRNYFKWTNE